MLDQPFAGIQNDKRKSSKPYWVETEVFWILEYFILPLVRPLIRQIWTNQLQSFKYFNMVYLIFLVNLQTQLYWDQVLKKVALRS